MHPTTISEKGVNLIKLFEGCQRVQPDGSISAYRCPAGRWTIGYGSTKGVRSGMKITQQEAVDRLGTELTDAKSAIKNYVRVPLTQPQYDSLVSFVYNVGSGNFRSSTLLKGLNQGNYDEVPRQLLRWNTAHVDGVLQALPGLTRRRATEASLFAVDSPLASEEGGTPMVQRIELAVKKPLTQSRTLLGLAVAGIATLVGALIPVALDSDALQGILLAGAAAGLAMAGYARVSDQKGG